MEEKESPEPSLSESQVDQELEDKEPPEPSLSEFQVVNESEKEDNPIDINTGEPKLDENLEAMSKQIIPSNKTGEEKQNLKIIDTSPEK